LLAFELMRRLELEDFLLIAEAVLGVPAEALRHATKIGLAEAALAAPFASYDGVARYRTLGERAAVLCARIVANHPLPDGNKRVALIAMRELIERNGGRWTPPPGGPHETAETIEQLAAGALAYERFAAWVGARLC
jgi:death on curing protein